MPDKKHAFSNIEDYLCLPFHVYLKDKEGKYLECNLPQATSFGQKIDDVLGRTDHDFLEQNQVQTLRTNENEVIHQEAAKIIIETANFMQTPQNSWLSIKSPARTQSGKVIGIMGISFSHYDPNQELNLNSVAALAEKFAPTASIHISKREKECLQLLTQGLSAKQIAKELDLSPRTVEFYIENIKKKFGCTKRTELIVKAMQMVG